MKLLLTGLGALALANAAAASPCADKIAKLQARANPASPAVGTTTAGSAAETEAAKLHHQPAPATPPPP